MRRFAFGVLTVALLPGCATMVSGSRQSIPIVVRPQGAVVCLDGRQVGTSPMVLRLPRRDQMLTLELAGYRTEIVPITAEVNPWTALNFLFLLVPGPFGLIIDIASGAIHQLEPRKVEFVLERADSVASSARKRAPCSPL